MVNVGIDIPYMDLMGIVRVYHHPKGSPSIIFKWCLTCRAYTLRIHVWIFNISPAWMGLIFMESISRQIYRKSKMDPAGIMICRVRRGFWWFFWLAKCLRFDAANWWWKMVIYHGKIRRTITLNKSIANLSVGFEKITFVGFLVPWYHPKKKQIPDVQEPISQGQPLYQYKCRRDLRPGNLGVKQGNAGG